VRPKSGVVWKALAALYSRLSRRRKAHVKITLGLMFLGGFAELVTIGSVIPFLALLIGSGSNGYPGIPHLTLIYRELGDQNAVAIAAVGLAAAAFASGTIRLLLTWVSQRLIFDITKDLGVLTYRLVLKQPYLFHVRTNSSEILSSMEKIQQIAYAVLMPGVQAIISTGIAIVIVIFLFVIEPFVTAIAATILILAYLSISLTTKGVLGRNSKVVSYCHEARINQVQVGLGGIRDILINHIYSAFENEYKSISNDLAKAQTVNGFVSVAPRILVEVLGVGLLAALAVHMNSRTGGINATIPVLGAIALGAQRLLPLLQQSYVGWSQYVASAQSILDVASLLELPDYADDEGAPGGADFKTAVSFTDVGFSYSEGKLILQDLTFDILKGERVGIIGKTGSGKSTLMDLLLGLLQPTVGQILVDGIPMEGAMRRCWQAQVAHVPQSVFLSDDTIAGNIAFGEAKEEIDMGRIMKAAIRAGIHDFIMSLPERYATGCGERGVRLSGGQRQRVGIARALYRNTNVLIFDEATSALDTETEAAVMDAITHIGEEVTVILIAHRITTLSACDKVLRLDQGKLAEILSYEALKALP
jgi:ATP-binding cassette, subfamily B, bacterial PglK